MKRREFLQRTSAAVAGGAAAWTAPTSVAGAAPEQDARAHSVLVTAAETDLARHIAAALADKHAVRLTSVQPVATELPFTVCGLESDQETAQLVQGVSSIVHLGAAFASEPEQSLVELAPRRTYQLLQAAVAAGVRRVVYLSSLDLLNDVAPEYLVDEDFAPQVKPGSGLLPLHLDEFCCREFARTGRLQIVVLRLGQLATPDAPQQPEDGAARLDLRDAVQAVRLALETPRISDGRGIETWSVFHILSRTDHPRYPISRAQRILRYEPRL
jgi:nucleoside-diphosphate-sugar epimerase